MGYGADHLARQRLYPLLGGQRWHASLLDADGEPLPPVQRVYRSRQPLNVPALRAAFRYVVSSHPALRMRLMWCADGWRQFFVDDDVAFRETSVSGCPPERAAARARDLCAEESQQPFDLTKEAPLRVLLITTDNEWFLTICVDHIAADDIAFDTLTRQMATAYARELSGAPHPESPAARLFFEQLDHEISQAASADANLYYWQAELADAPGSRAGADAPLWRP